MFQRLRILNKLTTFTTALSLLTINLAHAQAPIPPDPGANGGFFQQFGGPVKRKLARTQTFASVIPESPAGVTWRNLNLATLSFTVPAGESDLFNVSFTAECRLFGSSQNDYVRIQVLDLNTGIALEPSDGFQAFCSADSYATHTGMWSQRFGPGVHTLQVQFWILDTPALGALNAWIDDWTFELIVYD